jgi:hypothetical protein
VGEKMGSKQQQPVVGQKGSKQSHGSKQAVGAKMGSKQQQPAVGQKGSKQPEGSKQVVGQKASKTGGKSRR